MAAFTPGSPLPFGLYEVMIIPFDLAATDPDTPTDVEAEFVNLGYARSVAGTITMDEIQNQGNDAVIASEYVNERGTATVEQAGLNLNSLASMTGDDVVTDGVDPDQITYMIRMVDTERPYFAMRNRSRSSGGGYFETYFMKAKAGGGPNLTQGYAVFGNAQIPVTIIPNARKEFIKYTEYQSAAALIV